MTRLSTQAAILAGTFLLAGGWTFSDAAAEDSPAAREARWKELQQEIFAGKPAVRPDSGAIVTLDIPQRAEDASLVPVTVTLDPRQPVKGLYLVIDDNPSPLAAHYTFGPAADPHVLKMRVRVDSYTDMHAVAELQDGTLVETAKFIKASGGCSAPMGMSDEEAARGMGEMRLKSAQGDEAAGAGQMTLMVRHPNFNGMQMNQVTHIYTPPRYIQTITVKSGDKLVFTLATGISQSTNPVITFGLSPQATGPFEVAVEDSENAHWAQQFATPPATN